jgi:hypothetical protein
MPTVLIVILGSEGNREECFAVANRARWSQHPVSSLEASSTVTFQSIGLSMLVQYVN